MGVLCVYSRNLFEFIENHKICEEVGSPESGPMLDFYYSYPEWIDYVYSNEIEKSEAIMETNFFFDMEEEICWN